MRRYRFLIVLTLAVLGLALSAVAASAGPLRATSPIQLGNWTNGEDITGSTEIGKVTFIRRDGEMKMTIALKGLAPDATFMVALVGQNTDGDWYSLGYEWYMTTGSRGTARTTVTRSLIWEGLSFDSYFYVTLDGYPSGGGGGTTPKVYLPSS